MNKLTFTYIKTVILSVVFSLAIVFGYTQSDIPAKPNPVKFYNNLSKAFPNFLSPSEAQSIEYKLKAFSDSTSNQIVVVVIDTLNGLEPWAFATELGEKWSPGQEKEDNGIIVLIKPTGGAGQRKTFIATGRGLEAVIPDFTCLEIVNNELLPNFKNGNFYLGIDAATDVLMSLAVKEFNFSQYTTNNSSNSEGELPLWAFFLFFTVFILIAVFGKKNGGGGGTYYSSGGFSSSSSSFSSGSSFGGGSFGGGGAGGSW